MAKTILTKRQQQLLTLLSQDKYIKEHFYLSGGTALAQYYLQHRLSEDLDFFSLLEVNPKTVQIIFKKIKEKIHFEKVTFEISFNRNLFFLHFPDEILKTEFTYYPFEQIEQPKKMGLLKIDSLMDIAVNKADTILTHPRTRDFIDLYLILQKEQWLFADMVKQARVKFDTAVDALHIAQQLLTVSELKDYPRMLIAFDFDKCEDFWIKEAQKLKKYILK